MTKAEIAEKLELHRKWLAGEEGGVRADFTGADLHRADLFKANLSEADLSEADLTGAYLSGANLSGANLFEANLYRANLFEADLSKADLSGANLSKANLSEANLLKANLYEANLSGANLYRADLSEADLHGADLTKADLSGANLSGANLYRANLSSIKEDVFRVLGTYPNEAPAVLAALKEGRVSGSTYSGECACLVGTIANAKGVYYGTLQYSASSPAERWFFVIGKGDTPENSVVSAITVDWVQEFLDTNSGKV